MIIDVPSVPSASGLKLKFSVKNGCPVDAVVAAVVVNLANSNFFLSAPSSDVAAMPSSNDSMFVNKDWTLSIESKMQ